MTGNIPKTLTIIARHPKAIRFMWDDFNSTTSKEILVKPAFVSDSTNAKTLQTARSWGENEYYDSSKDKYVKNQPTETTCSNSPIKNIRIVGFEKRSEGGRAYKVVWGDNYLGDMREDVLLDTMLQAGVDVQGVLRGEFVWCRVNSEMKLVRVGSELHSKLVETTKDATLKKISAKDLIPGTIYESKNGDQKLFLGHADTLIFKSEGPTRLSYLETIPAKIVSIEEKKRMCLWADYKEYNRKDPAKFIAELISGETYFNLSLTSSCSVIKTAGTVDIPGNIIQLVRKGYFDHCIRRVHDRIEERRNREILEDSFAYYSDISNMQEAGKGYKLEKEYQMLLKKYSSLLK